MKKFLISIIFCSGIVFNFFGQNSAQIANKTTAVRCLKLAESCLDGADYQNAFNQAELGLSYDDSISDLFYIKAAAAFYLGSTKKAAADTLEIAFQKNNWIGYTKNGARIFYADLLCDTGFYEQSLKLLDDEPFIYSADAEVIRIKNYYRMGTEDSVSIARNKVNGARRVYSNDIRFLQGFFYFETFRLFKAGIKGVDYEKPEIVQVIANSFIQHLPDYSGKNSELELMASFFAEGDTKDRLIRAIDAKEQSIQPLLAIAGIYNGIYTEKEGVDLFFKTAENRIPFYQLQFLMTLLKDEAVKEELIQKITNLDSVILFDFDEDLQNELIAVYKLGRAASFTYDKNNDGVVDLRGECDLGAPVSVVMKSEAGEDVKIDYFEYPEVKSIQTLNESGDEIHLDFLKQTYICKPVENLKDVVLSDTLGLDFYIPFVQKEFSEKNLADALWKCSRYSCKISERQNSKIDYSMFEGQPVSADFYDDDRLYATCNFQSGLPFIRYVDYDDDEVLETRETFDIWNNEKTNALADDAGEEDEDDAVSMAKQDAALVAKIFSDAAGGQNLYLRMVQIDRNSNKFFEYSEEYKTNGDRISLWDNNDDGIPDCRFVRHNAGENGEIKEETSYFDKNGNVEVEVQTINSIPVKLLTGLKEELIIFSGFYDGIYWIEENGGKDLEEQILKKINENQEETIIQGKSFILQLDDKRVYIIQVGQSLFFRIIPEISLDENEYEE